MAYTNTTDVKAYAGVDGSGDDAVIGDLIAQAQAIIERACRGRVFEASADTTRKFHAVEDVDGPVLHLDADLCQITSITNGDGTAVTSAQYTTLPANLTPWYAIRLKDSSGVAWTYTDDPDEAISITGRWAWSVTAPADVEFATLRLAAFLYRQRDTSGGDNDRPIMSNSGAILLPSQLPKDVQDLMRPYWRGPR